MGQQLDDFADVSGLSCFLEEIEKFLERGGIVTHMPNDGVQVLQNFVGILGQQAVGMLVIDLKSVFVLAGMHESVGKSGDGSQVVVDGEELAG